MENSQPTSDNICYNEDKGFQCFGKNAGKNCSNKGTHQLKIIYINKTGWFCDSCKQDLIKLGLVEEEIV
ncbi:MAG: hypothetical protein R2685_16305 [Candidatus Nitrosocosmicus sp.]|nr:hypothetical protein [Candidatus Nitrosocosmicus sp.]